MTEHATADATASPLDPAAILDWFDAHERDLPWRRPGTTAWGVLVSEIMSQQTPVARVAPVWQEWMDRWPTPADFAAASRSEVLRAWGTLGYPRRALRLWECARAITADHAGKVPADVDTLLALPGSATTPPARSPASTTGATCPSWTPTCAACTAARWAASSCHPGRLRRNLPP